MKRSTQNRIQKADVDKSIDSCASLQTADAADLHGHLQPSQHPPPTLGPRNRPQESRKLNVRCVAKQLLYNPQRQRRAAVQNAAAADDLRVFQEGKVRTSAPSCRDKCVIIRSKSLRLLVARQL